MLMTRAARWALGFSCLIAAQWLPVFAGDTAADSEARLLNDVKYLASDELEGRGVGLKGLDLAAEHIRTEFAKAARKSQ